MIARAESDEASDFTKLTPAVDAAFAEQARRAKQPRLKEIIRERTGRTLVLRLLAWRPDLPVLFRFLDAS